MPSEQPICCVVADGRRGQARVGGRDAQRRGADSRGDAEARAEPGDEEAGQDMLGVRRVDVQLREEEHAGGGEDHAGRHERPRPVRGSSSADDTGPVDMMAATCGRKAKPVWTGE